ncbi:GNAT family N-acetyltransferase [Neptunicella sp.]|uniref:GNAT family N-acetyltransferase n=1 Tax=Neptunicella sp. TaxID=2125986 RepID=UPI003F68BC22
MEWTFLPANEFKQYKKRWNELNQDNQNLAILNTEFIEPLLAYYFSDDALLAIGREQGAINCMLFLRKKAWGRWETIMPSQAPLCLMVTTHNHFTDELLQSLCKALPGVVIQLDFLQLDSKNLTLPNKQQYELSEYIITGNRPVPEIFDDYFKSLGKNLRQNYNKVINRAAKAEQQLDCYKVDTPEDVVQGVKTYAEIEAKSWKADLGTAIEPDNIQGKYYTEMMAKLAQKNQACVWYYTIDQQIVACDLCVIQNHTLIILKTTFDDAYSKSSPALQMKVDMLRYYAEHPQEGIHNIEFFGKAMEWHKRLDSELRPINHLTWYPINFLLAFIKLFKKLNS